MSLRFNFAAVGLVVLVAACGTSIQTRTPDQPRTRSAIGTEVYVPGRVQGPSAGRDMDGRGIVAGQPTIAGGRVVGDGQRVCRSEATPVGWIAVAYVPAHGECSMRARSDSAAMAAVLTRYADLPANTVLEVCADERVPFGWIRERTATSEAGHSCPGVERDGSTTMRIRRLP